MCRAKDLSEGLKWYGWMVLGSQSIGVGSWGDVDESSRLVTCYLYRLGVAFFPYVMPADETGWYWHIFITTRWYGSAEYAIALCLSVVSECCTKMAKWIELTYGMKTLFDLSYTVFKEIWITPKIRIFPSGTLSQTLDLENFAATSLLSLDVFSKAYRRTDVDLPYTQPCTIY